MKNVTNKLQLVEDASEESILAGIEAIEKRATAAEGALTVSNKKSADDLAEMGNKVKTAEDALAAMKKEYEAAKAEADSLKDAANKAAAALAAEKAATLVENAVKEGKIKNEAKNIAEWKAKAVADLASVSALLEGIAVNKQAVRFKLATTEAENASKYPSVAAEMVAIENRLAGK